MEATARMQVGGILGSGAEETKGLRVCISAGISGIAVVCNDGKEKGLTDMYFYSSIANNSDKRQEHKLH